MPSTWSGMTTKTNMKGLLKGLRYISQIFDEKEPEIQIGYPTDVKHVAHIGWDGPSTNSPSWMNDLQSTSELSGQLNKGDVKKLSSEDIISTGTAIQDSLPPSPREKPKYKSRRKPFTGTGSPLNSPTRKSSDAPKPSRRHRSSHNSTESLTGDSPGPARRHQNSNIGIESPSSDLPSIPKHSHRRKSKGSSGDGSTKSSRSKGQNSTDTFLDIGSSESGNGLMNNESHLNVVLGTCEEDKGHD